jgi:hypothetical protein
MQVFGTQPPQTPGEPPPPQLCPTGQAPQSSATPHPSVDGPQLLLCCAQLVGTHPLDEELLVLDDDAALEDDEDAPPLELLALDEDDEEEAPPPPELLLDDDAAAPPDEDADDVPLAPPSPGAATPNSPLSPHADSHPAAATSAAMCCLLMR